MKIRQSPENSITGDDLRDSLFRDLITEDQLKAATGWSARTVDRRVKDGLPFVKFSGGPRRFHPPTVNRYLIEEHQHSHAPRGPGR